MNKQQEALKLALEAIEACLSAGTEAEDQDASDMLCDARAAIREALAEQPAQEPVAWKQTFTRAEVICAIEAERRACSIAVWMTLMEATEPGADDKGFDGWMREAEQRIKNRSANDPEAAQQQDSETIVQTFTGLPKRKLRDLLAAGWQINGVCFQRTEEDGTVRRGAVTTGGMVLWWNSEQPARQREPQPPYEFERYVAGSLRAQGVRVERATTLADAMRIAARICPQANPPSAPTVLVYTSPPASKPWVGLTDEEVLRTLRPTVWAHVEGHHREGMLADARAIEAKLREKNERGLT